MTSSAKRRSLHRQFESEWRCRPALLAALLLAPGLLGGCASEGEQLVQQGYPASYAQGYEDGCTSGKKAGGSWFAEFKKDVNRADADPQYAEGWSDGFAECKGEEEALEREIEASIEQQKMDSSNRSWEQQIADDAAKGLSKEDIKRLENMK